MPCYYAEKDKQGEDKAEKCLVIPSTNATSEPSTMMIKVLNAIVTPSTMICLRRLKDFANIAIT
jgi:hypothetical protein